MPAIQSRLRTYDRKSMRAEIERQARIISDLLARIQTTETENAKALRIGEIMKSIVDRQRTELNDLKQEFRDSQALAALRGSQLDRIRALARADREYAIINYRRWSLRSRRHIVIECIDRFTRIAEL